MSAEPTPTKRLSLSTIVELLLQRGGGDRSSVTLARNAKGDTQIEVVVRTTDEGSVTTAADALEEAVRLYEAARERYPMIDHTAAKGQK
jgi:hypothetical protein